MSAPASRRSVSVRRPIVNSALSIGTIRRPSASVTTRRGDPPLAIGTRDYNGTIRSHEVLMRFGRLRAAALLYSVTIFAATPLAIASPQVSSAPAAAAGGATNAPFWTGIADSASFERAANARMARAREALGRLIAEKAPRTIDNTLRPFDDVLLELDAVGSQAGLIQVVHP